MATANGKRLKMCRNSSYRHGFLIYFMMLMAPIQYSFGQETDIFKDFTLSLDDLFQPRFTDLVEGKIAESQFVLIGESHGIIEAGEITRLFYELGNPKGYKTLCIETDPLAARVLSGFYEKGNGLENAKILEKEYPFSIPFYNNKEDYNLLNTVFSKDGRLWGIDQSLMSQFRLSFDYLLTHTKNEDLKKLLMPQLDSAVTAYNRAILNRDFMAVYMFDYDEAIHQSLLSEATEKEEVSILEDLWKSREIYNYHFNGEYYLNNNTRGELMKANFISYYNRAKTNDALPKVIFKLGANHAARGLTFTHIYDIGNMVSELAISNGLRSFHVLVIGASGFENRANPIETDKVRQAIDYSNYLPAEFLELASASENKYVVIRTEEMRPEAKKFSEKVREFIFKFDTVILINDAKPLTSFD